MDKQFNQACEICWTNSWVPVPDDDPDAQQLLNGPGSVRCDYCWLEKQYRKLKHKLAEEREMCAPWMEHSIDKGCRGVVGECSCGLDEFLQLDLTKDLAPSRGERCTEEVPKQGATYHDFHGGPDGECRNCGRKVLS